MNKIMERVMKWLSTGPHRVLATVILTILIMGVSVAASHEVYEGTSTHVESAIFMHEDNGHKWMCLKTNEGNGFSGLAGYLAATCVNLSTTGQFQFCALKEGTPEFMCIPPGMDVIHANND